MRCLISSTRSSFLSTPGRRLNLFAPVRRKSSPSTFGRRCAAAYCESDCTTVDARGCVRSSKAAARRISWGIACKATHCRGDSRRLPSASKSPARMTALWRARKARVGSSWRSLAAKSTRAGRRFADVKETSRTARYESRSWARRWRTGSSGGFSVSCRTEAWRNASSPNTLSALLPDRLATGGSGPGPPAGRTSNRSHSASSTECCSSSTGRASASTNARVPSCSSPPPSMMRPGQVRMRPMTACSAKRYRARSVVDRSTGATGSAGVYWSQRGATRHRSSARGLKCWRRDPSSRRKVMVRKMRGCRCSRAGSMAADTTTRMPFTLASSSVSMSARRHRARIAVARNLSLRLTPIAQRDEAMDRGRRTTARMLDCA
mmetsp:Transcript_8676/g.27665  ORF Transcript_8676/g.27665 Transcript_8676/m.27665 type:complete len:377 (+) Transcript_8676:1783-2913(+)